MNSRSSADRFVHFGGEVVANVESSHGVVLSGGTTGGIVQSFGDDASIALRLLAKGAGRVIIGNSSNLLLVNSTFLTMSTGSQFQLGSTAPFAGHIRSHSSNLTTPAFSTDAMTDSTTFTLTGVNSSHMVLLNPVNLSTGIIYSHCFATSTADQVRMVFAKASTQSSLAVGASTFSANVVVFRF